MVKFEGGPKAAAKLLQGLDSQARKRVIAELRERDPKMAELIESEMVTFEDLKDLSAKQLPELLRSIELSDLALGLRLGSEELKSSFLNRVSKGMREEIEQVLLGPPQSVDKVEEAIAKIMEVVRQLVDEGKIVLANDDEYV